MHINPSPTPDTPMRITVPTILLAIPLLCGCNNHGGTSASGTVYGSGSHGGTSGHFSIPIVGDLGFLNERIYPDVPSAGHTIECLRSHYGPYVATAYSFNVTGGPELMPQDGKVYQFHHHDVTVYAICDSRGNCRKALLNRPAEFPFGDKEFANIAKSNGCTRYVAADTYHSDDNRRTCTREAPCAIWVVSDETVDTYGRFPCP